MIKLIFGGILYLIFVAALLAMMFIIVNKLNSAPAVMEYSTDTSGWSYPTDTSRGSTESVLKRFAVDNNTKVYLNGQQTTVSHPIKINFPYIAGCPVCVPCGDRIVKFKLDTTGKVLRSVYFTGGDVFNLIK